MWAAVLEMNPTYVVQEAAVVLANLLIITASSSSGAKDVGGSAEFMRANGRIHARVSTGMFVSQAVQTVFQAVLDDGAGRKLFFESMFKLVRLPNDQANARCNIRTSHRNALAAVREAKAGVEAAKVGPPPRHGTRGRSIGCSRWRRNLRLPARPDSSIAPNVRSCSIDFSRRHGEPGGCWERGEEGNARSPPRCPFGPTVPFAV